MTSFNKLVFLLSSIVTSQACGGVLNFASTTANVSENTATLTVEVTRTGDASGTASITVSSVDGTAKSAVDFTAVSKTLNWTAGDSAKKTLDITITDNAEVNTDKTFSLKLDSVVGDTVGSESSMTVTISDYEEGKIQFESASFKLIEGQSSAVIGITRVDGSDGTVSATIASTDDTATAPSDYLSINSTVTLVSGETSKSFAIPLVDDSRGEPDESFTLNLSSPTGGAALGAQASTLVAIVDDDTNFTPDAIKISPSVSGVTQPDIIDLTANSALTPSKTYIELVNAIPALAEPGIVGSQGTDGLIEIALGDLLFYLRPTGLIRNDQRKNPAVLLERTGSISLVLGDGLLIKATTAIASISSFLEELNSIQLPKFTVSDYGNVLIQVDQGPPKYETLINGQIALVNSYYDQWNLRPYLYVSEANDVDTGLKQIPHPSLSDESLVGHWFTSGSKTMVQYFSPTALIEDELEAQIKKLGGVLAVRFIGDGVVRVDTVTAYDATDKKLIKIGVMLYPDYKVTRVPSFSSDLIGFYEHNDANGDGQVDFLMIYSTGYQQIFFNKGSTEL